VVGAATDVAGGTVVAGCFTAGGGDGGGSGDSCLVMCAKAVMEQCDLASFLFDAFPE